MAKHEHDFRDGFDVCVGNYGYYNEGELHDTWMRLPMDPDKIEPWLRSHDLFDEEHEEIYIASCSSSKRSWERSHGSILSGSMGRRIQVS